MNTFHTPITIEKHVEVGKIKGTRGGGIKWTIEQPCVKRKAASERLVFVPRPGLNRPGKE